MVVLLPPAVYVNCYDDPMSPSKSALFLIVGFQNIGLKVISAILMLLRFLNIKNKGYNNKGNGAKMLKKIGHLDKKQQRAFRLSGQGVNFVYLD